MEHRSPYSPALSAHPRRALALAALVVGLVALAGCSEDANPLAPYEGGRPLEILAVTQSFTPDIQWVGGRAGAVGVNRGTRAALDSSLVWISQAPDNSISSPVVFGEGAARDYILSLGGTPLEELIDGETFTVWIAERSAIEVGLDSARMQPGTFADTTLAVQLLLRGTGGGDPALGVQFRIERDQRLTGDRFELTWEPADVRFRQIAIRRIDSGSPSGGFTNLTWHVALPEAEPGGIAPPVTIGETPPGAQEATAFTDFVRDDVFDPGAEEDVRVPTYVLWAATEEWTPGSFGATAPGYAFFRIVSCNFDVDAPQGPCQ